MSNRKVFVSKERLHWFLGAIYYPLVRSKNLVVYSIPGSGVKALTKFVCEEISEKKDKHIVPVLSINDCIATDQQTISSIKGSTEAKYDIQINNPNIRSVYDIFAHIVVKMERSVSLAIYDLIEFVDYSKGEPASFIERLRNLRSDRISFMFLQNFEAQSVSLPQRITYDTVYFPLADRLSVMESIKRYEELQHVTLSTEAKEEIWHCSGGDGKLTKQITLLALQNTQFAELLLRGNIPEVYSAVGEQYLNMRFEQIVNALQVTSIEWLSHRTGSISEYMEKTRLVSAESKTVYSPLFEYYIQNNKESLATIISAKKSDNPLLHILTGKEYELYSYLKENSGFNNKNAIGYALWSSKNGEKYSLWTLDKIISNLRKKLKSYPKLGKIITVRNKGVQLVAS